MRLLLDEHYSPEIARALRERGHDVELVKERADLVGLSDREVWERARSEGRALVTENAADFMLLVREAAAEGEDHFGVVFSSPRSLPRGRATIGVFVESVDALLRERPADDGLLNQVYWLRAPS